MIVDYNEIEYRGIKIYQDDRDRFWVERPNSEGTICNATQDEAIEYIDWLLDNSGGFQCLDNQIE